MSKVQKSAEITPNIPFTEFNFYDLYRKTFENTELGRIKRLLPLHEMAENLGLVSKSMSPKLGRKSYFTPEGKVALMFLKAKTQLSCPQLLEQLNGNIHFQMFCDIAIGPMQFLRGKEVKSVEFGAKCNNIMVDGLSFIEILSFNAFSEGARLQHCVKLHKRLFGVDVKKIGGDQGYAGTENRDWCKENNIRTSFVKRGRPFSEEKKKEKDCVRRELARVRATAMEGSFGTQKEHYSLKRVKARKKETEILYIFFGIHTANVVQLAERIAERQVAEAA